MLGHESRFLRLSWSWYRMRIVTCGFVACLEIATIFKAEHVTLPEPIRGHLPDDRERLLAQLSRLVEDARAGKLDRFRQSVMSL
jgi:hypothetical protein